MTANEAHVNSTARNYWDEPSELAYAAAAVGKKRQDDPAHRWYRLPSLENFKAGCSCGWMSPERDTFDGMSHEVDRHLDAVRQPRAAQGLTVCAALDDNALPSPEPEPAD